MFLCVYFCGCVCVGVCVEASSAFCRKELRVTAVCIVRYYLLSKKGKKRERFTATDIKCSVISVRRDIRCWS